MSTTVRKTADWRGEEYLEMSPGVGGGFDGAPSSSRSVRNVLNVRLLENQAWTFRNWFAGRIDPDSIERSWNSPVIADSHRLQLENSRCILVDRNREPLH